MFPRNPGILSEVARLQVLRGALRAFIELTLNHRVGGSSPSQRTLSFSYKSGMISPIPSIRPCISKRLVSQVSCSKKLRTSFGCPRDIFRLLCRQHLTSSISPRKGSGVNLASVCMRDLKAFTIRINSKSIKSSSRGRSS